MEFRKGITRTFSNLYREQTDLGDDEAEGGFSEFWGYYIWINQLTENKVWKINDITSLPLVLCLNHLSYLNDLHKEQDKQLKKQMKKQ
jgi:hypothetical protein